MPESEERRKAPALNCVKLDASRWLGAVAGNRRRGGKAIGSTISQEHEHEDRGH